MTKKPNILLIQVDQLTPLLMGTYGHKVVQTPNIDALAEEGVRFDAAYTPCPVCSPARACMVTGKYTSSNGAYDNAALLPADEPAMGHYLTLAGYDTVVSGKLHFVGPDQLHGFNRRLTTDIYPADFRWSWQMGEHGTPANQAPSYVGGHVQIDTWNDGLSYDEELHFRALEYLHAKGRDVASAESEGRQADPFFLFVSYHHPHEPFWPPEEFWDLYEGSDIELPHFPENYSETFSALDQWLNAYHGVDEQEGLTDEESIYRIRRAYYALVTYIDQKVGELVASLKKNGLWESTVIVFCSDHGDMLCEKGMIQKRYLYEMSTRVPLIVRFPDGYQAGRVCDEPVNLIDLLPTFLDLADVSQDERLPMDGRSLMGLLDGSDAKDWEAISETHADAMVQTPCFMLRQGKYKYIYIHDHPCQLFDLEDDPGEWSNLVGHPDHAAVEAAMRARIFELFDPDAIAADVAKSVRQRLLIDRAMKSNQTSWNYQPSFDPSRGIVERYLP